jgi:hypothetical protein
VIACVSEIISSLQSAMIPPTYINVMLITMYY